MAECQFCGQKIDTEKYLSQEKNFVSTKIILLFLLMVYFSLLCSLFLCSLTLKALLKVFQ